MIHLNQSHKLYYLILLKFVCQGQNISIFSWLSPWPALFIEGEGQIYLKCADCPHGPNSENDSWDKCHHFGWLSTWPRLGSNWEGQCPHCKLADWWNSTISWLSESWRFSEKYGSDRSSLSLYLYEIDQMCHTYYHTILYRHNQPKSLIYIHLGQLHN